MRRLVEKNRGKLIQLLSARLSVEEANMRLYGHVIDRLLDAEPAVRRIVPRLELQREEAEEHASWLGVQLQTLGEPPPLSRPERMARLETRGYEQVTAIADATLFELIQALLSAELADEAGWDLLVTLAASADDEPAREAFEHRRHQTEQHVTYLRRTLADVTRNDVLGLPVTLPIGL